MGDRQGTHRGSAPLAPAGRFTRAAAWAAARAERALALVQRFTERRPGRALAVSLALVVVGAAGLGASLSRGGRGGALFKPVFAGFQYVIDEVGLRLVEGHAPDLHAAAAESKVSPTLLAAIVYAESRGRGGQTSSAGALGLGQLTVASAADAARRLGIPAPTAAQVRDDDQLNLRLAAAHLAWLLENSVGWPLEQVLVSYNAGRARMFQWLERAGGFGAWVAAEERRAASGQATTGSLRYARQIVAIRAELRARGKIVDPVDFLDDPGRAR
ncbi:MAG: transglycosylase SLT domain-containing protein [Planctomycetota bacterium]